MFKQKIATVRGWLWSGARLQMLISAILVAFVGLPGLWYLWATKGVQYFERLLCSDVESCARLGQVGDLFGGVNALYAGFAFTGLLVSIELTRRASQDERNRSLDKELVEQVSKSYEWAFKSLRHQDTMTNEYRLTASRLGWLVSARHIVRAQKIVDQLRTDTYRVIQQEIEEYWRGQFYELLNKGNELRGMLNFSSVMESHERIAPVSISVILDFASWRNDREDPLAGLDETYALRIGQVRSMDCFRACTRVL